jgi:division protein CdvB (Snf7/Vps24/ESCRT-III family)
MPKLVYIAHPVAGNVAENVKDILRICKEIHTEEILPIAPYLVAVQYLDDEVVEERALGIATNVEHFHRKIMDEVLVCGDRISKGMHEELLLAKRYNIPVVVYSQGLEEEVRQILGQ